MMKRTLSGLAVSASLVTGIVVQPENQGRITMDQKRQAVMELARSLRARYAIGEIAEATAGLLERRLAGGAYDDLKDAREFADAVTLDLQAAIKDKHLRLGIPDPPPPPAAGDRATSPEAERTARRERLRQTSYGFLKAEILPGNVGYGEVSRMAVSYGERPAMISRQCRD